MLPELLRVAEVMANRSLPDSAALSQMAAVMLMGRPFLTHPSSRARGASTPYTSGLN
jgi:hypothetical protein